MNKSVFKSIFKEDILQYLEEKVSSGYLEKSFYYHLKKFDQFCVRQYLKKKVFTRESADNWIKQRQGEATTTHYSRVNAIKGFLIYLHNKGYNIHITRDIRFKQTYFKPHIYTQEEVKRYFSIVDSFYSSQYKLSNLQYPVLFRFLYCCGTRINETLGIRKRDVDLESGIIKLFETKNNCERYIVLNDGFLCLLREYADKCFYLISEDDYIFRTANGGRCRGDTIYRHHRVLLKKAGIPYIGDNEGPRVHDWRYTFAVNSFKKMIDDGLDMYVALPILSTYLGHKTIYATEKYVRLTMEVYPFIEKQFKGKMDSIFGETLILNRQDLRFFSINISWCTFQAFVVIHQEQLIRIVMHLFIICAIWKHKELLVQMK